jgi:hypothetical protein
MNEQEIAKGLLARFSAADGGRLFRPRWDNFHADKACWQ